MDENFILRGIKRWLIESTDLIMKYVSGDEDLYATLKETDLVLN